MKKECITDCAEQTCNFACEFGKSLRGGDVVLLCGEMGAGKTHFVKGLATGLGISDTVTSPTFAIHNQYSGRLTLNHFDFYRIDDVYEAEILGLDEYFYDKNSVAAIEWSEKVKELIPKKHLIVQIDKLGENKRRITVCNSEID